MLINLQDWIFSVDTASTNTFCIEKLKDQCQCGYCRNFYRAVDLVCSELRPLLMNFGVLVETPDELMPFEPTLYAATFCVSGSVVRRGASRLKISGMELRVLEEGEIDFPTDCPAPFFALTTSILELPWVLDEDMNEVISPANEPEYLERMWRKLLSNAPTDIIDS